MGRELAKRAVEEHYAKAKNRGKFVGCEAYGDFRELCARKDIDAILVATPDHWHALVSLEALRNGKDVYCEKPVTHLFGEGQVIYREVKRRGSVFQTGSMQRSYPAFRHAVELVRNGLIGKVKHVEIGLPPGYTKPMHNDATAQAPPDHLDYDLWCGPSPRLPYMPARHHRWWRGHLAYGGGTLMDWIGHHNDIAHWGLNMDKGGPVKVEAVGWEFPKTNIYNAPSSYEVRCEYPSGITSSISSGHPSGIKWIGEDGWVYVRRGTLKTLPVQYDLRSDSLDSLYVSVYWMGSYGFRVSFVRPKIER